MIELTRLNGYPMLLNSDLIKTAEASPDTMLTLINGEKLIVREELTEVLKRVVDYRAALLAAVARRLSPDDALLQVTSMTSVVFAESTPHRVPSDEERRGHEMPTTSVLRNDASIIVE